MGHSEAAIILVYRARRADRGRKGLSGPRQDLVWLAVLMERNFYFQIPLSPAVETDFFACLGLSTACQLGVSPVQLGKIREAEHRRGSPGLHLH
jgi:hypothetical protein